MNHFITFLMVIAMYFGLNEAGCKRNGVVIHNELSRGVVLDIKCNWQKPDYDRPHMTKRLNYGEPFYGIYFKDNGNIHYHTKVYCRIGFGSNPEYFYPIEVYAADKYPRCGQLRSWIAKHDGIYFTQNYWKPAGKVLDWIKKP
ncbi:unnamed protein product [Cochlearia groenlandica]